MCTAPEAGFCYKAFALTQIPKSEEKGPQIVNVV